MTCSPCSVSCLAAIPPAAPEPMMHTSYSHPQMAFRSRPSAEDEGVSGGTILGSTTVSFPDAAAGTAAGAEPVSKAAPKWSLQVAGPFETVFPYVLALKGPKVNSRWCNPRNRFCRKRIALTPKGFNPSAGGFDPFRVGENDSWRADGPWVASTAIGVVPLRGTRNPRSGSQLRLRSGRSPGPGVRRRGWRRR
jgi:hypothetical protein